MGPRSARSVRKKILIWTSGGRGERELADCLRAIGYEPVVYTDVHDIVAVSAAEIPDLIVLDLAGGSSSAEGAIAQLEARGADKTLPMLVLAESKHHEQPDIPLDRERGLQRQLEAAEILAREGIDAEVVDPPSR